MYAERKAWPLTSAEVNLHYIRGDESARIDRFLTLDGDLTAEQRTRLADIAERTPVTLTLKAGIAIHTTLV